MKLVLNTFGIKQYQDKFLNFLNWILTTYLNTFDTTNFTFPVPKIPDIQVTLVGEFCDCLADGMQIMFFQEQTSFTIVYVQGDSNNFILFSQKYHM